MQLAVYHMIFSMFLYSLCIAFPITCRFLSSFVTIPCLTSGFFLFLITVCPKRLSKAVSFLVIPATSRGQAGNVWHQERPSLSIFTEEKSLGTRFGIQGFIPKLDCKNAAFSKHIYRRIQ